MSDYISRKGAIDELQEKVFHNLTDEFYGAMQAIDELPSADVVPVRLGEWLDGYKMQTCSLCKCRGKKSWTFCPHCGARMIYGERKKA